MCDIVEEQKTFNAQLNQRIHTVENSLSQKLDGLQSEIDQKFDNLQSDIDQKFNNLHYSISRLTDQQHVHQEEVNPEEECLINTTMEEQCKQQNEAISLLLTEEGSGRAPKAYS